jgi:hypothetical protein
VALSRPDTFGQPVDRRTEAEGGLAGPVRQGGAIDGHALAGHDLRLPVERRIFEGRLELVGRLLLGAPAEPGPAQLGDQVLEAGDPLGRRLGSEAGRALGRHDGGNLSLHGVAPFGRKPVETRGAEGGRRHARRLSGRAVPSSGTEPREAREVRRACRRRPHPPRPRPPRHRPPPVPSGERRLVELSP